MSRSRPSPHDGLVLIDKEVGWTSHDVVAKARGVLGTRKVGHAGTLDPPATGLLLVGVGKMTRLLRFLTELPKTYTGQVVLGSATSTLDDTGEVTARHDMGDIPVERVRAAVADLTGAIEQIPPMVSALKVDGRRLHELARAGEEVERAPRPVTVYRFDVAASDEAGVLDIEVECSAGTYVRSLADDLGRALGGSAHLRRLRRIATGPFDVGDAHVVGAVDPERDVIAPIDALDHLQRIDVDGNIAAAVGHGRPLPRSDLGIDEADPGPWRVCGDGRLLAVYGPHRTDTVKPAVVLA